MKKKKMESEQDNSNQLGNEAPAKSKRTKPEMKDSVLEELRLLQEEPKKPIEIKSGSLKSLFCTYSYNHTVAQNTTNDCTCKSQVPVHHDLTAAFNRLNIHLAVICEEISPDDINDIDSLPELNPEWQADDNRQNALASRLSRFSVSSFRIIGNGENEGVLLTGYKLLTTKEVVQLTTPVTKYFSEYPFVNELRIAIADVVNEIEEYMLNGKQAPKRQQEMNFSDDHTDGFQYDEDL